MSKRFTETEKWRDPWFRKLSPQAKLLFLWLVDNCDKAGVIDFDAEAAAFDIGQPIKSEHLSELDTRILKLENGKLCLVKFVPFQYGTLSKTCTPHLRVLEAIHAHGLSYPLCETKSTTLHTTLPTTLQSRVQEKRGKEGNGKEPEKRGAGGEGNGEGDGTPDQIFSRDLMAFYRRTPDSRLTHLEESTLAEIIRVRPRYRQEWDTMITFSQNEPRYFPQSLSKLLTNWQETLDRAVNWTPKNKNSDHKEMQETIHIKEL